MVDIRPDDHLSGLVSEGTITRAEHRWFLVMASMLGIMLAIIVLTGMTQMLHPLSDIETVSPNSLHIKGEFIESNLGVVRNADGSVTVRMIAQQYIFAPQCVIVPANTPVHFRLTSADVTHGFFVGTTNTNAMVVPGFVTNVSTTFHQPESLKMPCDEYCGLGHHGMAARVRVMPAAEAAESLEENRGICGPQ